MAIVMVKSEIPSKDAMDKMMIPSHLPDVFLPISPELPRQTSLSKTLLRGSGPIDPHLLKQKEVEVHIFICASLFKKPPKTFASLEGIWKGKVDFSYEEIEEAKIKFV